MNIELKLFNDCVLRRRLHAITGAKETDAKGIREREKRKEKKLSKEHNRAVKLTGLAKRLTDPPHRSSAQSKFASDPLVPWAHQAIMALLRRISL